MIRQIVANQEKKIAKAAEDAAQKIRDQYKAQSGGKRLSRSERKKMEEEAAKAQEEAKDKQTATLKKKESGVDTLKELVR